MRAADPITIAEALAYIPDAADAFRRASEMVGSDDTQ